MHICSTRGRWVKLPPINLLQANQENKTLLEAEQWQGQNPGFRSGLPRLGEPHCTKICIPHHNEDNIVLYCKVSSNTQYRPGTLIMRVGKEVTGSKSGLCASHTKIQNGRGSKKNELASQLSLRFMLHEKANIWIKAEPSTWINTCTAVAELKLMICVSLTKVHRATVCVNWLRPSDARMRQQHRKSLVQIMACRLFSAKPSSESMLKYCHLDP